MKWIPAVALVVGFINCDNGPAQAPPEPPPVEVDVGPAKVVEKTDVAPPVDPNALFNQPFLYKITKKGNHRTSWLFGTVTGEFPMEFALAPKSVQYALTSSTHAMFEVPTGSGAARDRIKLMAMNEGSARRELGSAKFKKLVSATKSRSDVLDVMKPWVIYTTLEEKLGGDPPMDELFEGFAQSYRMRIKYLETVPQQVALLDKEVDFEVVGEMIEEFDDHQKASEAAVEAYKVGSTDGLKASVFPDGDARSAVHKRLIETRVPAWAAKLGAQFDEDPTLAVVSVRYIVGPTNLVDALKALGWDVERVTH